MTVIKTRWLASWHALNNAHFVVRTGAGSLLLNDMSIVVSVADLKCGIPGSSECRRPFG